MKSFAEQGRRRGRVELNGRGIGLDTDLEHGDLTARSLTDWKHYGGFYC